VHLDRVDGLTAREDVGDDNSERNLQFDIVIVLPTNEGYADLDDGNSVPLSERFPATRAPVKLLQHTQAYPVGTFNLARIIFSSISADSTLGLIVQVILGVVSAPLPRTHSAVMREKRRHNAFSAKGVRDTG
jgi:hypothetical protein